MKIEYLRELRDSYMQIINEDDSEDYQIKMLERNEPEGFLKVSLRKINGETRILYKLSSYINMEDRFLGKEINYSELEELIKSFKQVLVSVDKYLLDCNGILLKPEHIFADTNTGKWKFTYFPGKETSFQNDMKELFEYVIRRVNHKDIKAVTISYGIYKKMCEENINLDELFYIDEEVELKNENDFEQAPKTVETEHKEIKEEKQVFFDFSGNKMVITAIGVYLIIMLYVLMGIFVKSIRITGVGGGVYGIIFLFMAAIAYMIYRWYDNKEKE